MRNFLLLPTLKEFLNNLKSLIHSRKNTPFNCDGNFEAKRAKLAEEELLRLFEGEANPSTKKSKKKKKKKKRKKKKVVLLTIESEETHAESEQTEIAEFEVTLRVYLYRTSVLKRVNLYTCTRAEKSTKNDSHIFMHSLLYHYSCW